MKKLRLIEVPINSKNHYINNVGCLRYEVQNGTLIKSSVIEPEKSNIYLESNKHKIVGYTEIFDTCFIVIENI